MRHASMTRQTVHHVTHALGIAALLALLAIAAPARAQEPPTIVPGETVLAFDHDGEDTDGYELCIDSDATCEPLTVAPVNGEYHFTAPGSLTRGVHTLIVFAVNDVGRSEEGAAAEFRVRAIPANPTNLRRDLP